MNFSLSNSIEILEHTPGVLGAMLKNLSNEWTAVNEGGETWSAYDVVGHLIHGELTDWIPRMEIILAANTDRSFQPYDRFAQFEKSKGKNLHQLLDEFTALRQENMKVLKSKQLTEEDLQRTGVHPAFGEVTLAQLLATWTVHDLNHIAQISRVMATQYKAAVGPWTEYLRILHW